MDKTMQNFVYGPVPSRRLGRSLGIDLVPFKTCTYNCIYCQLGLTTCKTIEKKEWVHIESILQQLEKKLSTEPDYITLAGSGEPTLNSGIGVLIEQIKKITAVPVAVLTNGSLLWDAEVRSALMESDLVIPSLDAGEQRLFQYINRPHSKITFDRMIEGLVEFRKAFSGQYWLEVVVLGGVTVFTREIENIAGIVREIEPDRVQLNTVTRPPAEKFVISARREHMELFIKALGNRVEVITEFRGGDRQGRFKAGQREILDLLSLRPSTIDDIAGGLGMHRNEVVKHVEALTAKGELEKELHGWQLYYKAARPGSKTSAYT